MKVFQIVTGKAIFSKCQHSQQPKPIFIGCINELHYFSSVPDKTGKNKSKLTYLKRKLLQTDDQKETRVAKRRNAYQTNDQKQTRPGKGKELYLSGYKTFKQATGTMIPGCRCTLDQ